MKKIAIFSHGAQPRLGALEGILPKLGLSYHVFQLGKGEESPSGTNTFDGVILMGGTMAVYERDHHTFLDVEMTWVEEMIAAGKPVLGICLGCQMLAHMHKGEVFAGDKGTTIGFRPLYLEGDDSIFGNELKGQKGFSWQGDTYTLGQNASRLISGCTYHEQGVKFGEKVYGVQFHPEITKEIITAWYIRDLKNNQLSNDIEPLETYLDEWEQHAKPVHEWLEKFISRLFVSYS